MRKILIAIALILFGIIVIESAFAQYIPGENVTLIVSVSDAFGNPIENASCIIYIFDPNFNLIFSDNLVYRNGFYVSNFTVPSRYGTYLEYAVCNVTINNKLKTIRASKTFFVSSAFDVIERQLSQYISNVTVNVSLNITGNITQAVAQAQEDIIGLLLALHSTPETSYYCYNETHRAVLKTATWTINDKTYNITKYELMYCERGCNNATGECIMPTYTAFAWAVGIILAGIFLYVIFRVVA